MKIDLVTSVWGEWHLSMYLSAALPTLMAPENLPALARQAELNYQVLTTPEGKRVLERSYIFQQLAACVPVQISLLGKGAPRNEVHMEMMHASVQAAAARNAYLSIVPPDVVWPGRCFSNLFTMLEKRGPRAVSIPCIRVVSETFVEEISEIYNGSGTLHLDISPQVAQTLILRHLHPEQLVMFAGNPFSRPTLWATFPVQGGGILHCTFNREWFTVSPSRLAVTEIFCNDEHLSEDDYYVCQDAEEMIMLSLTPMRQYMADMRRDWPFHQIDVAGTLKMSQHGVPFAWSYVRSPLPIGETSQNPRAWSVAQRRANLWASGALALMHILRILDEIRKSGYARVANFISYGIINCEIHRHRRLRRPLTGIIPVSLVNTVGLDNEASASSKIGNIDLSTFFNEALWNYIGPPLEPDTAKQLEGPQLENGTLDTELVSYSGNKWRLRASEIGAFVNDRPILDVIVKDRTVIILY